MIYTRYTIAFSEALLIKVKADVSVHHAHVRISEDANSAAVSNSISDGMADANSNKRVKS